MTAPTDYGSRVDVDLHMPKLSDSMEEGTILRWHRVVGDRLRRGEELVEVETDKATIVYEAELDGVLTEVLVPEGGTAPVGGVIARITSDGAGPPAAATRSTAPPQVAVQERPVSVAAPAAPPGAAGASTGGAKRARATPIARRAAHELGIDLAALAGSGPGGRIVRADVRRAADAGGGSPTLAPAGAATADGVRGGVRIVPLTSTQQTIARRMAESRSSIPSFTVTVEVDVSALVRLQQDLREALADTSPSFNDLVVKAVALTLREHPRFNSAFVDGAVHEYGRVNVGVAVATEDALVVPAVLDADRKSVVEIARESRSLVERARQRSLSIDDLTAGTFTVSNLGMFGVLRFEAIVNPPQVAILAVGAATRRPVVDEHGRIGVGERLELTLSSDHRVIYGADAARFLRSLRERLERPIGLLVDSSVPG